MSDVVILTIDKTTKNISKFVSYVESMQKLYSRDATIWDMIDYRLTLNNMLILFSMERK